MRMVKCSCGAIFAKRFAFILPGGAPFWEKSGHWSLVTVYKCAHFYLDGQKCGFLGHKMRSFPLEVQK